MPPTLEDNTFEVQSDIPVYVPCGATSRYQSNMNSRYNYIEMGQLTFAAVSEDSVNGIQFSNFD